MNFNYGTFILSATNDLLTKEYTPPIREHVIFRDLRDRAIDADRVENCLSYEFMLSGITGIEQRVVVFLDITNVKKDEGDDGPLYPVGIDGFLRRNGIIYQIVLVNLKPMKADSDINGLAEFFESFRAAVNDIFNVDPYLTQRERLILSYFFAFAMVYRAYMPSKEVWLSMQTAMKSQTNRGVKESNNLYEKLSGLINVNNWNESSIIKAFEEGIIICVEPDSSDETGPVPEVPEGE